MTIESRTFIVGSLVNVVHVQVKYERVPVSFFECAQVLGGVSVLAHEAVLRAGSATIDITPRDPVIMSGYGGRTGRSTGVADPLQASALVLDDASLRVAIVSVDLLNVSHELAGRVRSELSECDEVVIAATHTHAGPYVPARALDISSLLNVDEDVTSVVDPIEQGIVEVVKTAATDLAPATIGSGTTTVEGVAENRRASGGVSGNVRIPFGDVDPTVQVVTFETDESSTILYHFACHPVCTRPEETLLSADWPGYARQRILEDRPEAHVLFLNGAAGDINPSGRGDRDPYAFMDYIGTRVGDSVLAASETITAPSNPSRATLRADRSPVSFPRRRTPSPSAANAIVDDLEAELATVTAAGDDRGARAVRCRLQEAKEVAAMADWDATVLPGRVTYLELGAIGLLGMPGEVHTEHGRRFQAASTVDTLLPISYADGYVGYLPTLDDLQHVGYEVRTMKVAPHGIVRFRRAAESLVGPPTEPTIHRR